MESWGWFKEYGFAKEKFNTDKSIKQYNTCHRTKCLQTLDRKIDICSKAFMGKKLNLVKNKDFIDLEKTMDLRNELVNFYKKDIIEACEYCKISDEKVQPALQE